MFTSRHVAPLNKAGGVIVPLGHLLFYLGL